MRIESIYRSVMQLGVASSPDALLRKEAMSRGPDAVSALVFVTSGPGSSRFWGHSVVFLANTLKLCLSLHPNVFRPFKTVI